MFFGEAERILVRSLSASLVAMVSPAFANQDAAEGDVLLFSDSSVMAAEVL